MISDSPAADPGERLRPWAPGSRRQAWMFHALIGLFLAVLVCAIFHSWLEPYHQPERGGPDLPFRAGDLTPLYSVWTQVAARSLYGQCELPLWSDHIYCGEPLFAKPQIGVFSITILLCALVHPQVAATWTFLIHLWIGGISAYAWNLDVLRTSGQIGTRTRGASLEVERSGDQQLPRPCGASWGGCVSECLAAACGAVSFMLSGLMVEHAMMGHAPIVLVACWTPLVLRLVARSLSGDRPVRNATMAGTIIALQLLAGGETVFLYNVIAGGLLGLAWIVCGRLAGVARPESAKGVTLGRSSCTTPFADSGRATPGPIVYGSTDSQPEIAAPPPWHATGGFARRAVRLASVTIVLALIGFGLSAVKVLPGLELMPLSNRAGGLSLSDASQPIVEFREPAVLEALRAGPSQLLHLRYLFPISLFLAGVGLYGAFRQAGQRWLGLAALFMVVMGAAIAHSQAVFGLFWYVIPMFRYQRIPQRALVLVYQGLSVLVSLGAQRLLSAHWLYGCRSAGAAGDREMGPRLAWRRLCFGWALVFAMSLESWVALPSLPPSADIRDEIEQNQILNYVARQPGRFRIHTLESVDRNWGIEHVTVPLGLENLVGWDHLWLLEYLGAEGTVGRDVRPFVTASYQARHPARFWGMMSVRFLTTMQPLELSGLQFVAQFPPCSICQPAKSAGPYVYENLEWLPRAWIVPHAILVFGERAEQLEAVYNTIDNSRFDPRRAVVIRADRPPQSYSQEELSRYRGIALPARWEVEASERAGLPREKVMIYSLSRDRRFRWDRPAALAAVLETTAAAPPEESAPEGASARSTDLPELESYRTNSIRMKLPPQTGFLVLAEKSAHFPGWHARTASGSKPLLKANAVASAIELDGSEGWVEWNYWPRTLTVGLSIAGLTIGVVPLLIWRGDALVSLIHRFYGQ